MRNLRNRRNSRGVAYTASLAVVLVVGVLLSLTNVLLIRKNQSLRAEADYFRSLQHTQIGIKLPALRGKDREGRDFTVSYPEAGAPTLIFVFTPNCTFCRRSWSKWLELARTTKSRVVFVNVGGPLNADFIRQQGFGNAIVVTSVEPESILKYGFYETPITLLVSPAGVSEKVWSGEIGPSRFKEIQDALGTQAL